MALLSGKLKNHLNKANSRYIELNNIDEIIASKYNDFDLLNYINKKPKRILNIGIGNGLELITLYKIYKKEIKIIGIDVSTTSIDLAKKLIAKNNIGPNQIELIKGNATSLSFPDGYFDIIFMNSLLHEVFSYSPNGNRAWKLAIEEAYRVLALQGLLYIEDFAATNESEKVKIIFKSDFAKRFYNYFCKEYRSFNSWGKTHAKLFSKDRKLIIKNMPVLKKEEDTVILGPALSLELLTHFKIFNNDLNSGMTTLGDREWIEINERYYPSTDGIYNLSGTDLYIKKVLDAINKNSKSEYQLQCLRFFEIERPNFTDDTNKHFSAYTRTGNDFIKFSSKKMRLIFKKVV